MNLTAVLTDVLKRLMVHDTRLKTLESNKGSVEATNANLFTRNDVRWGASLSSRNTFHSASRFLVTAIMNEWIRTPALDVISPRLQTGKTYTVSALTDKGITEFRYYFNSETQYMTMKREAIGSSFFLYTISFTLKNNVTPQTHFNMTANNGEILQMKLEEGAESTLLNAMQRLELRLDALESGG